MSGSVVVNPLFAKKQTLADIQDGRTFKTQEGVEFTIVKHAETSTPVINGVGKKTADKMNVTINVGGAQMEGFILDGTNLMAGLTLVVPNNETFEFVGFTPAGGRRKSRRVKKRHVSRRAKRRTRRSKS
jgi:hypothetical protein